MSDPSTLDRAKGCLVGLAAGDALGGPLEFMSREQIRIKHGLVRDFLGGGWLGLRPGQGTDDTAMATALAESLVDKGGFDAGDAAARYVEWLRSEPLDVGHTTRRALAWLADGGDLESASRTAHEQGEHKSAGNGTVMRCAPLAVRYRRDRGRLVDASLADARITHYDRRAGSGSACLNLLLAMTLDDAVPRGPGGRPADLLPRVSEALEPYGDRVDDLLPRRLGGDGPQRFYDDGDAPPATGYVVDTLRAALWAWTTTDSFEACLVRAVNLGDDADTVGAVAGALAGAWYGLGGVPERWLDRLEARSRMVWLAGRLAAQAEEEPRDKGDDA